MPSAPASQPPKLLSAGARDLLEDLKEDAERIVELMISWDEDNSGTADKREFQLALPVLDLFVSSEEADEVFEHLARAAKGDANPRKTIAYDEIEHWALFRTLVVAADPEADVEAAEAAARAAAALRATKHDVGDSNFWSRDVDGRAKNRHELRKRRGALRPRDRIANVGWSETLGVHHEQEEEVAGPRLLQTVALDSTASVQEQLREALRVNLTRVTDLFVAWDDNGDGRVSRREFCRGVRLFGLSAPMEEIQQLYDSFDPNGDGSIEFGELNALLRQTKAPEPEKLKMPSLLSKSTWGKAAAQVALAKGMRGAPAGHERLKAALAQHAPSVIQLFKHADLNGDGRINRSEFVEMVLTYAPLHEHPPEEGILPYSAEDAEALFALLDRDRGGTIDYRELERELKRDLRGELEDAKLRERASSLLRRTDVVVVLGAATKTKQALCRKLAYVFDGVWVSKASLVERELHAYGSKLAPEIRRRMSAEPPKPLSTSFYRQMLHAAVHGRRDHGALPALHGPFFLFDLPRTPSELVAIELAFGAAPLTIDFVQADFDELAEEAPAKASIPQSPPSPGVPPEDSADSSRAALRSAVSARVEQDPLHGDLLVLDSELEVRRLAELVVRHLSVSHTRRLLAQREKEKVEREAHEAMMRRQREYLEAAATYMRASLDLTRQRARELHAQRAMTARDELLPGSGRREYARYVYQHHAWKQGSTPWKDAEGTDPLSAGSFYGAHDSTTRSGASSARALLATAPTGTGLATLISPPDPAFRPRTDLQMAPRNWRAEPVPLGLPSLVQRVAKARVYEKRLMRGGGIRW